MTRSPSPPSSQALSITPPIPAGRSCIQERSCLAMPVRAFHAATSMAGATAASPLTFLLTVLPRSQPLITYFTPDAIYHNIPLPPLEGIAAIHQGFKGLPQRFDSVAVKILNQISAGDLVMNERVDYFVRGGRTTPLPIAGVFRMENGKIRHWNDYFDLATFRN